MKRLIILCLSLAVCTISVAQKKDLKIAEKAIKNSNFADAKVAISAAEALLSAMDDKTKAKLYFLKGKALYAAGSGSDTEITDALKSFKMLNDIEQETGRNTYASQVNELKVSMLNAFIKKASDAYEQKKYAVSSTNFERAYQMSNRDTLYLFNSASVSVLGKDYNKALQLYENLMEIGYTGIAEEFYATNAETGEEQSFPSLVLRDASVKSGSYEKSRNVKTKSKAGEIAKNIALIYIEQGENEKAIEAIERAKELSPNDFNLLISEANIRYKTGDKEKYKILIAKALSLEPNNAELLFNLGVVAADENDLENAKKYYNQAIEVDATYTKAKMNMAALILNQEQDLIEEMNDLGSSAADNKRYDELLENRQQLYKDAIPYLTSILDQDPNDLSAAKTLMNIYSAMDDMPNYNAMKAKVEALSSEN